MTIEAISIQDHMLLRSPKEVKTDVDTIARLTATIIGKHDVRFSRISAMRWRDIVVQSPNFDLLQGTPNIGNLHWVLLRVWQQWSKHITWSVVLETLHFTHLYLIPMKYANSVGINMFHKYTSVGYIHTCLTRKISIIWHRYVIMCQHARNYRQITDRW